MSQFAASHASLHYRVTGRTGPWVLLCHALGTDSTLWSTVERSLTRAYRVLSFDLPGHGQSSLPAAADCTFEAMADAVRDLLDHLQVNRVSVIGISVGGEVAQMFAARHAPRVDRLMLVSTACVTEPPRAVLWQERIDTVSRAGTDAIAAASVNRWFTAGFRARHPELIETFRRRLAGMPAAAYIAIARTIQTMDLQPAIRHIACSTLVIYGREDANTGVAAAARIVDNIRHAELIELAGAAHFPNLEAAVRFNRQVHRWLAGDRRP